MKPYDELLTQILACTGTDPNTNPWLQRSDPEQTLAMFIKALIEDFYKE